MYTIHTHTHETNARYDGLICKGNVEICIPASKHYKTVGFKARFSTSKRPLTTHKNVMLAIYQRWWEFIAFGELPYLIVHTNTMHCERFWFYHSSKWIWKKENYWIDLLQPHGECGVRVGGVETFVPRLKLKKKFYITTNTWVCSFCCKSNKIKCSNRSNSIQIESSLMAFVVIILLVCIFFFLFCSWFCHFFTLFLLLLWLHFILLSAAAENQLKRRILISQRVYGAKQSKVRPKRRRALSRLWLAFREAQTQIRKETTKVFRLEIKESNQRQRQRQRKHHYHCRHHRDKHHHFSQVSQSMISTRLTEFVSPNSFRFYSDVWFGSVRFV